MTLAPIILFTYNRPWHTRKTIEALAQNFLAGESDLIVYSDGAKCDDIEGVAGVRKYLNDITPWFKSVKVIARKENYGLANSIIDGVTNIIAKYQKVIVLEDDLVSSRYFLTYMNKALDIYENNNDVVSIHAYLYPLAENLEKAFFLKGADCWGWATWKRGWDLFMPDGKVLLKELKDKRLTTEFDFDGSYPYTKMLEHQIGKRNNSWAIRWYASAFLAGKLTLYPNKSYVQNIGNDSSGTHSEQSSHFDTELNDSFSPETITVRPEQAGYERKLIIEYFRRTRPGKWKRFINKILPGK